MKQPILLAITIILMITILNAQTPISGGVVSGTWTAAGSPYQINGDIIINSGETLTIEPGVEVVFQGYYKLEIDGSLMALGAQGDSILFTINDTTGFSDLSIVNGGWNGIYANDISIINNTTNLDYCVLTYSKNSSGSGGAIRIYDYKEINITNCRFENNRALHSGGAISSSYITNFLIEDCVFKNNYAQNTIGAINLDEMSNVDIIHCEFKNNHSSGSTGAIELSDISSASVNSCLFKNNYAPNGRTLEYYANSTQGNIFITGSHFEQNIGGAIRIWHFSSLPFSGTAEISNNIIYNNQTISSGGGISIEYDNILVENNLVANNSSDYNGGGIFIFDGSGICRNNIIVNNSSNTYGGGICTQEESVTFYNNTIANNNAVKGGGIYSYSDINVYNSIIYGNTKNSSTIDNVNQYSCIVNLHNCITDENPYFINPTSGTGDTYDALNANWDFNYGSPCHNGGDQNTTTTLAGTTDYAGNPRVYDNIIDIGAYEKQSGAGIEDNKADKYKVQLYPNPAKDNINITLENQKNEELHIQIVDVLGKEVYSAPINSEITQIDMSSHKKGMYYAKIYSTGLIKIEKIIKQ